MIINAVHKAACHCGAVEFELNLPQGLQASSRCNCSICRKRGAIAISLGLADLKVAKL